MFESVDVGGGGIELIGINTSEKAVNAVSGCWGVSVFSEEPDFSGCVREGSVNNESAEISW